MDPEMVSKLKKRFRQADTSGDGVIDRDELKEMFRHMGEWPDDELDLLISRVDQNGDGAIDYNEFIDWIAGAQDMGGAKDREDELPKLGAMEMEHGEVLLKRFRSFDMSGDGVIDRDELGALFREIGGEIFSDEGLDLMFSQVDRDGTGVIDYREFVTWVMGPPPPRTGGIHFNEAQLVHLIGSAIVYEECLSEDTLKAWLKEKKVGVLSQGPDGTLLQEGPTEELSRVFVVFDPRILHESLEFATNVGPKVQALAPAATDVVVLVPAASSAPQYTVSLETALQYMCLLPAKVPEAKVKYVWIDEYYQNPDYTLEVLAANPEKTCYTGSLAPPTQLSVFFKLDASLGYKEVRDGEEMQTCEKADRFSSVYSFRAYTHWAFGVTEDLMFDFHSTLMDECEQDHVLCPASEKALVPDNGSVPLVPKTAPTAKTVRFYAFSNLEELGEKCGSTVIQADPEGTHLIEGVHAANHIPVILLNPADIKETSYEAVMNCIKACMKEDPVMTTTVVLLNESFEAHCSNPWLVPCLHLLIEYVSIGIFAIPDELPDIANLLTIPGEHVPFAIATNSVAFPRLHFFTMKTAMGQELEDHEIFGSAVTCGPVGSTSGLDRTKFLACKKKWAAMVLQNEDGEAMVERLLIQNSRTSTLIAPFKLLTKIVTATCEQVQPGGPPTEEEDAAPVSWKTMWEACERDDMELLEAVQNCRDIISEMEQYGNVFSDRQELSGQELSGFC